MSRQQNLNNDNRPPGEWQTVTDCPKKALSSALPLARIKFASLNLASFDRYRTIGSKTHYL